MEEGNLFLKMESQRERMPHIIREKYVPVFIANLLRDKLCRGDDELSKIGTENKKGLIHESYSEKWTDDSLMEDFTDFECSFLIREEDLEYVDKVLIFAKHAIELFNVDERTLWKSLFDVIEYPNLELLWLLDSKYHLFPISKYLMMLKQSPRMDYFQRQFLSFCFSDCTPITRGRCSRILDHFLHVFLISTYCNPGKDVTLENLEKSVSELLFQMSIKLVTKEEDLETSRRFLLAVIQGGVPNSLKKKYFSSQLIQLLTTMEPESSLKALELDEVLQYQERFAGPTFILDFQSLSDVIVTMIRPPSPLTPADVLQVLVSSMESHNRNWNRILLLITEWIQRAEFEASSLLKETIKTLMHEGIALKNEEKISIAFILARHCSLVAPKIFSRYEQWYTNMFKEENYTPAKEPDQFNFLVNLLTRWLEFEPSSFLQVQAFLAWPFIPSGCKSMWSDYVSLGKVRVADYNDVESAMEFEPNPNNPVLHDVEMAIKEYENSRNIPKRLAVMFMFKKQYYKDQFLPVLLKKPQTTSLSDARLILIEDLNRNGKIPPEMYVAYKQCKSS